MAEDKLFDFELVSPEERLLKEPAWQVSVPAEEGTIGVRAGHASLVTTIKPGVVKVWGCEGEPSRLIFIAGGFADVTAENLTVLAEEAVDVEDLNAETLESEINRLNEELKIEKDEAKKQRIVGKMKIASAKLHALAA